MSKNRTRNNRIYVHLNDEEKERLEQNMAKLGVKNRDAFVRKMALDGYIIHIDTEPVKELIRLARNATTNINQVVKVINTTGSVYESDIATLQAEVKEYSPMIVDAYSRILKLCERY